MNKAFDEGYKCGLVTMTLSVIGLMIFGIVGMIIGGLIGTIIAVVKGMKYNV